MHPSKASQIAKHAWTEDHPICWDGTRILQHANRTMKLISHEGSNLATTYLTARSKIRGGALEGCVHQTTP